MKKYMYSFFGIITVFSLIFAGCSAPANEETGETPPKQEEPAVPEEQPLPVIKDLTEIFSKTDSFKQDGIHYTQQITSADQTSEVETWIKGDLTKSRITSQGEDIITITNNTSGEFITYFPSQKTGIKYNIQGSETSETPEGAIRDIEDYEKDIDPLNFEVMGREKVNGVDTIVIKSVDSNTGQESTIWISDYYGIMMKMEAIAEDDSQTTIEVTEFEAGNIADTEFQVPDDIEIQEF